MLNQSISRFFIFLLILMGASLISCSSSNEDPPATIDSQNAAEPIEPDNTTVENRQDDSAEIIESVEALIEQQKISSTFVGTDPAVLNITFSADIDVVTPADLPSYENIQTNFDQAKALDITQQFGMGDLLFTQSQSGNAVFYAFKNGKRMEIFPNQVLFSDTAALNVDQATFSADQVESHVENILAMWIWPTFDYRVVPISSNSAEVRRVIDGVPVNFADMSIQISSNGELASFSLFMPELSQAETSQTISAEEALNQLAISSFEEANIRVEVSKNQIPEFQTVQPVPQNSWSNRYSAGAKVNLTGSVVEYLPANGPSGAVLFLDHFKLSGAENMLDSLYQHGNSLVTLSGTISPDESTLELDVWSAADLSNTDTSAPLTGVLRLENGNAFLDNSRLGDGYLLIDPPSNIMAESDVIVYQNFYFSNEDGRFIEWNTIELQNRAVPPPPQVNAFSTLEGVNTITISHMEIAYGRPATGSDPVTIYAPVWHIHGSTDSGLSVVFTLPATK